MHRSLLRRVFAVNAGLLGAIAVLLLLLSPVEIDAPIKARQALIVVGALAITLATSAVLLRRAFAPFERLAGRMDTVDLLRPGQRLPVTRGDVVGRVVAAFNHMLHRLERERHENARRVLAAQEAVDAYRIAQESLTNVGRHSEARHVTIALGGLDSVVLRVVDDGRGFDGPPVEHGGLRSMRERAVLIGGALAIERGAAGGVDVRLEVPAAALVEAVAVD